MTTPTPDMKDKICLVTGATSGLGKATALGLAKRGATVILVSRTQAKGEATRDEIRRATHNESVHTLQADLMSQAAIRQLADQCTTAYPRLDILVNNAGGVFYTRTTTPDGIETSLAFNHLANFLLTHLLLDTLKANRPSRIVNVTTRLFPNTRINFDDLQFETRKYNGFGAYGESKLANILFTRELAARLEGSGVTVNCVHPGIFRSNFGKNNTQEPLPMRIMGTVFRPIMPTAEKAAERVLYVITSPELATVSGRYLGNLKELTPPKQAHEAAALQQLWALSMQLTGLS